MIFSLHRLEFLYFQLLPELSNNIKCVDLVGEYQAKLNNVSIEKLSQSFNTFLPKPYRRNGKFLCLPHQTEGLINVGGIDKWAKGETTAKNERRYVLQMQQGNIDYKNDGINSMNYEFISIDTIYNRHKMINVKV